MRDTQFDVEISVKKTCDLLKSSDFAELIDEDYKEVGNDKEVAILVFEKYFIRVKNRVSLVVIVDNIKGNTHVKAIGTGGGRNLSNNFDWGASDHFEFSLEKIFKDYINKSEV